jgi:hypothetical protein
VHLTGIVALADAQHLFPCRQGLAHETGPPLGRRGCLLYRIHHERMGRHPLLFGSGNSALLEFLGEFQ